MKIPLAVFLLIWFGSNRAFPQKPRNGEPFVHKFEIWGEFGTTIEKFDFLIGVTNGFFLGDAEATTPLMKCLSSNLSYKQAVAMVDKFYKDHPEKWSDPASLEVIDALTGQGSPCSGLNPVSKRP